MIYVDAFNYLGQKVAVLEFADDAPQELIDRRLAFYAAAPVTVLKDVSPRQIRQALVLSGVAMADIEAALASLPEPTKTLAQIEWEYSVVFQRNRPLVSQVAAALGWTSAQLDALWELAATL